MKSLLLVGAGTYQIPAISAAHSMGVKVIAIDGDPNADGLKKADRAEVIDVRDINACIKIARSERIDGVLSICTDAAVETVAAVAEELGLPGIGREVARAATDKGIMRHRFAAAGLPGPRYGTAAALTEARKVAAGIGYPLVIKPVDNAGSRGVRRLENDSELKNAFELAMEYSRKKAVILEEFLKGIESTIESLSYGGRTEVLAISDKEHVPFPECVAVSLTYPPRYSRTVQRSVADLARRAVASLGIGLGPTHIEVIVTPDGPRLIEVAARGGGYRVFSDIVRLVSGVDIVRESVKIALGMEPKLNPIRQLAAELRFLRPMTRGRVRAIRGVEEARWVNGIVDVVIELKVGDMLKRITRDEERPGYVIAVGTSRAQVKARASAVEKLIRFEVDPDEAFEPEGDNNVPS